MTKRFITILLLTCILLISISEDQRASAEGYYWKSVWNEEFHKLDQKYWNLVDWESNKNSELQYYRPDNVSVKNGILKLTAKKQKFQSKPYTSGAITTNGKVGFKYGRIEVRAKMPAGKGMFPAIWMMPTNGNSYPEIDIAEMIGSAPTHLSSVIHWMEGKKKKRHFTEIITKDLSKDFHVFTLERSEDKIVWKVDGKTFLTNTKYLPTEEMYLYLNVAVGGVWPGSPDHTTKFPVAMEIDYVRYYEWTKKSTVEVMPY